MKPVIFTSYLNEKEMKLLDQIVGKMICEGVNHKNVSIEVAKKAMQGTVSEPKLIKFIDENYAEIEAKIKVTFKSFGH